MFLYTLSCSPMHSHTLAHCHKALHSLACPCTLLQVLAPSHRLSQALPRPCPLSHILTCPCMLLHILAHTRTPYALAPRCGSWPGVWSECVCAWVRKSPPVTGVAGGVQQGHSTLHGVSAPFWAPHSARVWTACVCPQFDCAVRAVCVRGWG